MYYLHEMKSLAGNIIVVSDTKEPPAIATGLRQTLEGDDAVYYLPGEFFAGPIYEADLARDMAIVFARRYNYDVLIDGKTLDLPLAYRSAAAAVLGAAKSERKQKSSRANGQLGGRPKIQN